MTAEYSTPTIILRLQNYNKVSFGALLGACPQEILRQCTIVLWKSDEPPPGELLNGRALLLYSFMIPDREAVAEEIAAVRSFAFQNGRAIDIWAGGAEATLNTAFVATLGFDLLLAGEGEEIFPQLLKRWIGGERLTGVIQAPNAQVDLDLHPGFHPATEYLPPIELSRGCAYGCVFCAVPALYKGVIRHRSLDKVLEIASSYLKIAPTRKRIKFLASNAFAYGSPDGRLPNLDMLYKLLSGLKSVGVPEISLGSFPSEVRPDFVTREVLELVRPFLANNTIVMGIQTPINRRLREIGRRHTIEQAIEAIELLREFGFRAHVDFIIGMPGETLEEQEEMISFIERIVKVYNVRIHMHTFMPLPGAAWEHRSAEAIAPSSRIRLRALAAAGVLDGWWENQIAYSRRR